MQDNDELLEAVYGVQRVPEWYAESQDRDLWLEGCRRRAALLRMTRETVYPGEREAQDAVSRGVWEEA